VETILFEDRQANQNYPVTLPRPAFAITCGIANLYDLLRSVCGDVRTIFREYLAPTAARLFPGVGREAGPALLLNASLVPDIRVIRKLKSLAERGEAFLIASGQRVAAAYLPKGMTLPQDAVFEGVTPYLLEQRPTQLDEDMPTLDYPFDLVKHHLRVFDANLQELIARRNLREVSPNVYLGEGVKISKNAVLHAGDGPIVLDDNATVQDFAYLKGPLYVGPNSRIIERSSVKEQTSIGHTCKIGGEVEASVIEPYTNKQHHGFLGHSYVGSWVNLGAGTSNSDLKNTYGMVRMDVNGERMDTGMQFLGCVVGDFSKTAINTSIFTGKIVGVASMLYGFVTTNVPSFCNYARAFGEVTAVSVDAAIETQRRMFIRRQVEQTQEDVALLHAMHERTRHERTLVSGPLSL